MQKELRKFVTSWLFRHEKEADLYLVCILQTKMDSFETWYMQVYIEYNIIENENTVIGKFKKLIFFYMF
jgi:hypothetical protein